VNVKGLAVKPWRKESMMRLVASVLGAVLLLGACGDSEESADDALLDCLEQADDTYNSCESDCADDQTCIDECTATWCDDVEACGEDMSENESCTG